MRMGVPSEQCGWWLRTISSNVLKEVGERASNRQRRSGEPLL